MEGWHRLLLILIVFIMRGTYLTSFAEIVHYSQVVVTTGSVNDSSVVVIETEKDVSVNSCIKKCKLKRSCNFVNYHVRTRLCFKIRVTSNVEPSIAAAVGYVYGKASEWDMVNYEGCQVCPAAQQCNLTTTPASCHVTGCGPPPYKEDTVIHGNIYDVGSDLVYSHVRTGARIIYTCFPNGTWHRSQITEPATKTTTPTTPTPTTTTTTTIPAKTSRTTTTPTTTTTTTTTTASDGFQSTGWIQASSSRLYKIVSTPADWITARDYCDEEGSYLVVIYTSTEDNLVSGLVTEQGITNYWAGATDAETEDTWVWVLTSLAWNYDNWAPGQPGSNKKDCLMITPVWAPGGMWSDEDCDKKQSFVCEKSAN